MDPDLRRGDEEVRVFPCHPGPLIPGPRLLFLSSYRRRPVSIVHEHSGPRPGITHKIKILRGPIVGVTAFFEQ